MLNKPEDRKKREKNFHNQRYSKDQRKVLSPIYTFAETSKKYFENIVSNVTPDENILEIGCGKNSIGKKIAEKGTNVTQIDISEKAIELAKQLLYDENFHIECLVMDAENLMFDKDSFHLVYGIGILHHLSIDSSLMEIKKVLKKGGRAIFYEPLGHNIFINLFRKMTPNFRTNDEHPLLFDDLKKIKSIFPNTNFHYFHLFSIITIPLVKIPFLKWINFLANYFDRLAIKVFPFFKKYCWVIIIEINN